MERNVQPKSWVMTERGWRHRPWWKHWINTVLIALQPGPFKWLVCSNCTVADNFAPEPPEVLSYGFGRVQFIEDLGLFTNVDPKAREVVCLDPDMLKAVELACSLLLEAFPEAEVDLEFSREMDEGAAEDDFLLGVIAYTAGDRLDRLQLVTRRWATLCKSGKDRVVLDAEMA